jgi:glycosyltransferase involved in cell wall biosynthesis
MKFIDVRIPYTTNGNLGQEYNRIINSSKSDWFLFLDDDIFLLHPNWYYMCQIAIKQYPQTGLFTCWTNRSSALNKRVDIADTGNDLLSHYYEAKRLFTRFGYECTKITDCFCTHGFILISRLGWEIAGGFPAQGTAYEICDYAQKLIKNKIELRIMQGMYIYHLHDQIINSWISGVPSRMEMIGQECKLNG